jgi:O-methyltransferase
MPETDPDKDLHRRGDFSDTTLEAVKSVVGNDDFTAYHQGLIPNTFKGLEHARISFAHIDVDIYKSVSDCCLFIFPRLVRGGFIIFDDYGFPSCPGARSAVDEYFRWTTTYPLVLPTGQAIIFKNH